jgi:hypothetical protein
LKIEQEKLLEMKPRSISYDKIRKRPETPQAQVFEKVPRGDFYGKQIQDRDKLNFVAHSALNHLFNHSEWHNY